MSQKSIIPRKYRIGQWVITKSGLRGKVVGSAIYGTDHGKPTRYTRVDYRIKVPGKTKAMYRTESELRRGSPR